MKKQNVILILSLSFVVVLSSLASAFSMNNLRIEDSVLNTNVSINETIYADLLDFGSGYIYFENLTVNTGSENITYTINITASNTNYYYNSTRKDLPYLSSSSDTTKVITGSIKNISSGSGRFTVSSCNIDKVTNVNDNATSVYDDTTLSCSGDILIFTSNLDFWIGTNTLTIDYFSTSETYGTRTVYGGVDSMSQMLKYLPIIILAIIVIFVIGLFIAIQNGNEINLNQSGGEAISIVVLVAIGVLVCIFIFILISGIVSTIS